MFVKSLAKNGGKLIGGKAMECLKDFQWSSPPDCSCENPNVSEPIELITKCDAIPKMGKCFVRCKSGYDMEGINYTTCQNNGKWGSVSCMSKVSCPEPALSSSILKVNGECSGKFYQDACFVTCREGGQLIGEAKIKCEDTGVWSSLPLCTCPVPNSSGDLVLKSCNAKRTNEHCFVQCKENLKLIGDAFFVCQKNTKWSSVPKCIPKICSTPNVPEYLEIKRNCSFKQIGEYCEVGCKQGGRVIGTNTTQCLSTSTWSSLPDCTCPVPNVTQSLIILKETCNFKKRYEHCAVACPQGYAFLTDGAFACLHNATWSPLPVCVKTHCSRPKLDSEILNEDENCTLKKIGETCRVQCVQGGHLLDPKYLTCLTGGNWSSSPRCSCPILSISNDLNFVQDCKYATPGFKCFVECKENLKINGQNYILCMNNSKWSFQPKCVKTLCPNLVLQDDLLELKEVCSTKAIGDVCQVACKNGGKLIGGKAMECLKDFQWSSPPDCSCENPNVSEPIELITKCDAIPKMGKCFVRCKSGYDMEGINYTTCQNNGKWGAFPACQKVSCPEPALSSSILKVNGECSGKFYQDACFVTCREGGQLIGEAKIKCEDTGVWSSLPLCTCPVPNSSGDLVLKSCNAKRTNEHCFVQCKENLKLIGDAFCVSKNTKWSSVPKCIPKICSTPNVPEYLEIKRNCSFKQIGEYCEVGCKQGGRVIGTNTTQCMSTSTWSSLPDCTCPVPNVTQSLIILKETCNFKKRYEHCAVACPQGYAFLTDGAFACLHNATWSPLPVCVKTHCSRPKLDSEILNEDENCTLKKIGETCRVQCVQGGHLLDPKYLTCLTGGNWSSSPRCSCPILSISNDLNFVQDCKYATPGFKCFVECKENLKINGQNYILCMNNSKWSFQPKCVKTLCPNLVLQDDLLELKEVCSTKAIGDVCQVACKNGGKLIGGKAMECLKDFQWSSPPDCSCENPNVSEPIELITKCDAIPKMGKCFVRCKSGYDMEGINYTTCQNNGKWGAFPACQKVSCPEPALSSSILKVNGECSGKFYQDACFVTCREGGQLIGEAKIKCENTGVWSSLPLCTCPVPNSSGDLVLKSCNAKRTNEHCFVECKENLKLIGNAFFVCQKNTKWSSVPKCIPKICPPPNVPEYLEIKRNCSSKQIGEYCEVGCKQGGRVIGTNTTQCMSTSTWSSLPDCTCPVPNITQSLIILKETCNFKKRYEHCAVACPQGYAFLTDGAFACLHNATWSPLPVCVKTHCSRPKLDSEILNEDENCTLKKIGETCRVQCVQGGHLLDPKYLTCLTGGNWSSSPRCSCPILSISNDLNFVQDCKYATPGFKCFVECKENLKLNGQNYILCMNNSKWSFQPRCVKTLCPNLVLQDDLLELKEVCSTKAIGDVCQVACKNGGKLIGGKAMECLKDFQWSSPPDCSCENPNVSEPIELITKCDAIPKMGKCFVRCKSGYDMEGINYTTCQNNGKWGAFPACQKVSCPEPALSSSILKVNGECSGKFYQDACFVKCREGGHLIGEAEIKCEFTGVWSSFPHCTCPAPIPSIDLVLKNCNAKRTNEHCFVECKENLKLIGDAFFLCQKNTKWSSVPKCIPKICPSPNVPEYLEINKNCSSKKIGEYCEVSCKHGGKVTGTLNGKNKLKCLKSLKWSLPPDCSCANPNASEPIELITKCDAIPKMGKCFLRCKRGYDIAGINYTTCQNNRKWGVFPTCRKISCPEPALSSSILKVNGECSGKSYQDACFVTCREGGQLIGEAKIKCENTGVWSSLPLCTCPVPNSSGDLVLKSCNAKRTNEHCFVECKENLKLIGNAFFVCQKNTKWSSVPKCIPKICPPPNVPEYLEIKRNCSSKQIGEYCEVGCKQGGRVIGTNTTQCMSTSTWSSLPDCTCPVPNITQSLIILKETCNFKKRYEHCAVACPQGYAFLTDGAFVCLHNATGEFARLR
ncbi:sushi, von Willebrand factor type A, EGF and pentraxin domain-containing protein 1 [Trichonephila clavipes]|nr:sushi, von Willebrand factor type A, EGF and pentraxin domain-containing protein 1 [Trichonephila clavipes]